MIAVRHSEERGRTVLDWLDSRHTFSFGDFHDPAHMGFRSLRVINEDRVRPGKGFGAHSHRDMEILSYVLAGELAHRDSLRNESVIRPGEIQRMTAGTGVTHAEFNPSPTDTVHFLQIWILPRERSLRPGYEQRAIPPERTAGRLHLAAAPEGRDDAVTIHQDVGLYVARLDPRREVVHAPSPGRHVWVQVARGAVALNGRPLAGGDGAAMSDEARVEIAAREPSEVLLFDLA